MIKINLLGQKKDKIKIPVVMGLDFSKISWAGIAFSVLVYFGVEYGIKYYFQQENDNYSQFIQIENGKLRKIKKQVAGHKRIKDMLQEFESKKEQLKTKTQHVTQILENKSNPRKILERLARDIGTDIWFKSIKIEQDNLSILGSAYHYNSIGDFISRANQARFFGKSLKIINESVKTETINVKGRTTTIEHFQIKGKVITYE